MEWTGKTYSMLQRLPDFYNPNDSSTVLARFLSVLAERLDALENGIYDILRAHHFPTAGNQRSQGYLGSPLTQRGDLDKILAFYLEAVGGTSQLVKMDFRLRRGSFDVRRLARALLHDQDSPSCRYLWKQLSHTARELLLCYSPDYSYFREEDIPGFIQNLALDPTPLGEQVRHRLTPPTLQLLGDYNPNSPISDSLREPLLAEANELLLNDNTLLRDNFSIFEELESHESVWPCIYGLYPELIRKYCEEILDKNPRDLSAQCRLEALEQTEELDSTAAV